MNETMNKTFFELECKILRAVLNFYIIKKCYIY